MFCFLLALIAQGVNRPECFAGGRCAKMRFWMRSVRACELFKSTQPKACYRSLPKEQHVRLFLSVVAVLASTLSLDFEMPSGGLAAIGAPATKKDGEIERQAFGNQDRTLRLYSFDRKGLSLRFRTMTMLLTVSTASRWNTDWPGRFAGWQNERCAAVHGGTFDSTCHCCSSIREFPPHLPQRGTLVCSAK